LYDLRLKIFFLNLPFEKDMETQHFPTGDYSRCYKFNGKELG
jgi:hypothetical protein